MARSKFFEVLSEDDLYQIDVNALRILDKTGIKVRLPEAVEIFRNGGCRVNGNMVYFPAGVVRQALSSVPPSFKLYGRDSSYQVTVDKDSVYYEPMIGRLNYLEYPSLKVRRTTLEDVKNLMLVADFLEGYSILHSGAIMPDIKGIPYSVSHIYGYIASVTNSSKIIKGSCRGKKVAQDCLQMASIVAGGKDNLAKRPCMHTTCNIISPLELGLDMTEGLIEFAQHGVPIDLASEPQMGATSPVTIAGTLAQQTAELLAAVVLTQLVRPGTPVTIGTVGAAMDMKNGSIALGGVEAALINVAHAQIGRYYSIPTRGSGCNTESKILDMQAGFEKSITLLLPALAGINIIFYPGTLDHALCVNLESLVVDHEICQMSERIRKGVSITTDSLSEQLIGEIGPGGQYLTAKHTFLNFEKEYYIPKLSNRDDREKWAQNGSLDIWENAHLNVKQILQNHTPKPIEEAVREDLLDYKTYVERRENIKTKGIF